MRTRFSLRRLVPGRVVARGLLLAALAPAAVFGYDLIRQGERVVKWPNGTVNFQVMLGTSPVLQDGSNYSTSALAAIEQWNQHLINVQLAGNIVPAAQGGDNNGINELFFSSTVYGTAFGENTIAVCTSFRGGSNPDGSVRRTQADILFNSARTWNSYRGVRQGNTLDIRRVALHELGHALGLDHPDETNQTVSAVMNSRVSDVDSLREDDIQGAQFLYGVPAGTPRPANDNFANAAALTLTNNSATINAQSVAATKEVGEPNHAPNESGGASVWWRWTAPSAGNLTIDTRGTNYDTLLAAYTGNSVATLTQIAANDDIETGIVRTSTLTFSTSAGTTYHFAVDGWAGEWGNVRLNVNFTPTAAPPPPLVASQTVTIGQNVSFAAQLVQGATYQWQSSADGLTWTNLANGGVYSGATTSTLTISGASASLNGTRYRYLLNGNASTAAVLTVAPVIVPFPVAIAADSAGNLYVGDTGNDTIVRVTPAGAATTFAGSGGQTGTADGTGTAARFNDPSGIAIGGDGTLSVSDTANATVRRISATGVVTTLAGSPNTRGNTNGTGSAATFRSPLGLAQDASGNLYVADAQNHTIRRITPAGVVTTFAGSAGASGSVDGTTATARFNNPTGVAVDGAGNVYVADTTNNTIRRISAAGVVTTLAGVAGISGSSDGVGANALFNQPSGLALDSSGNLYVADTANSSLRRITPAGVVTTLAGLATVAGLKDGVGSEAWFNQPRDLAMVGNELVVADTGNAILRRVTISGTVTTVTMAQGTAPTPPPSTTPPPTTTPPPAGGGGGSGGGGGGAPSIWFLGALTLAALARCLRRGVERAGPAR